MERERVVPPYLEVVCVNKHFGGIRALSDMSFSVAAGEVAALAGANGAGKSTLLKVLAGHVAPDAGEILIDGQAYMVQKPADAARAGLNFLHQELNLVPHFSVLQNMMLGHPDAGRHGWVDRKSMRSKASAIIDRLGVSLRLDDEVKVLSTHQQWTVALGHALMRDAKVLALDEPTASMAAAEVEHLFGVIRDLAADGCGVIYVSHRLSELLEISDNVTVMRDGRLVGSWPTSTLDREALTHHIVGHAVSEIHPSSESRIEREPVLVLDGVQRAPKIKDASLVLHPGEILGLAGLVGSGRTEIARIIFGADRATSGRMLLDGEVYAPRSVHDAVERGVALVPEERRAQGLLLKESVAFNVGMAAVDDDRVRPWLPFVSPSKRRRAARVLVDRLGIKTRSENARVDRLSGGNQQKVVVAKWLRVAPKVLILDEPTVGVDVGAREDMYSLIRELAEAGNALIMISSDFDELTLCHRIAVVREGAVVATVNARDVTKDQLTRMCYATSSPDQSGSKETGNEE